MADKNAYEHSDTSGQTTLKEILIKHFFYALDDLRGTWRGKDLDIKEFNMDILYLIRAIPNKKRQKEILAIWEKAQEENYQLKEASHLTRNEIIAYSGMEAVTEVMIFICESFELVTEDITGPATSKQFRKDNSVIEIPDIPETITNGIPAGDS